MSIELSEHAKDFLLFSYFGVTSKDIEGKKEAELATICAQRAYLDLNRTLKFNKNNWDDKTKDKARQTFRRKIVELIEAEIFNLLDSDPDNFDSKHSDLCNQIIKAANSCSSENSKILEKFTYGQAQKWLNMTIKYMWLLGRWDSKFKKLIGVIHVPVDSYIIDAARDDLGIKKPKLTWSNWEKEDYEEFLTKLRGCPKEKNKHPIEWEGPAWIKIAKERK